MATEQHSGLHYSYPTVPCKLLLPGPLGRGTPISVQGTIPADASRFSINLGRAEGSEAPTVVFHFNPRFSEGSVVVRNSCTEGSWGPEERSFLPPELPLARQKDFRLVITPDETGYQVVVDGSFLLSYAHRLPLELVTYVEVEGDVMLAAVDIPIALTPAKKLLASVPAKMQHGDVITIHGTVPADAERFDVMLQSDAGDAADLCLYVNPRFDTGHVVRNSRFGDAWGHEEDDGGLPLRPGRPFVFVVAAVTSDRFRLWVDERPLADFAARCPLDRISHVVVGGHVVATQVRFDSLPYFLSAAFGARPFAASELVEHKILPEKGQASVVRAPGGMSEGHGVVVVGAVPNDAKRLDVRLQCGDGADADIVLLVSAQFDAPPPRLVLNSRVGGAWGVELLPLLEAPLPFDRGAPFRLVVVSRDDGFHVTVNDRLVPNVFAHRRDPIDATHVLVENDVSVLRALAF